MKTNPPTAVTLKVSISCALLAVISLCAGQFVLASVFGCIAAANLIIGNLKTGY